MRIRRAATLVCTFEGNKPVLHNFLKKEMFECDARALDILAVLDEWMNMEDALARLPEREAAVPVLRELIQRDLILIEGSAQAERDRHYRETWRWGSVAAFYHFSLRDSKFVNGEATAERLRRFRREEASPPLLTSNEGLEQVIALPDFDRTDPFFDALFRRRSQRNFGRTPISLTALANCLFAGNGVKEIKDGGDFGQLPLTMTPSGGARNPFELYVQARNVDAIEPGFYHYSAFEHSLGRLHHESAPAPSELFGDQKWANEAAALVFLCATFERSAWKYRQALAYRVVLMEAGAIIQNVELAATHMRIFAAPTGALAESRIEQLLGLDNICQAAIAGIALGSAT